MTNEIDTNEIRRVYAAWNTGSELYPVMRTVSTLCDALDEARTDSQRWEIVAHARLEAWEPMKERVEKAEAELALWDLAWTRECRAEAAIARVRALCEASLLNPGSIRAFMAADILAALDGDVS